jgi:hypothetical protein
MSFVRRFAALLLVSLALARPAAAVDYTDIWFNSTESGWGVNLVQSNQFIFATFFVYGPGNQPFWYTAHLTRQDNGSWTGALYQSTGTYFGNPWNSNSNTNTEVGTATFTPSSAIAGTLAYTVGGTSVSKQIQRQTLTTVPLGGKYSGAYLSIFANCADPANNGPLTFFSNLTVTQTQGGPLRLQFDSGDTSSFTMSGSFIQDGTLFRVPNATYTMRGTNVSASVSEVKGTSQGIEGTWTANVGAIFQGCVETGYFSALYISN